MSPGRWSPLRSISPLAARISSRSSQTLLRDVGCGVIRAEGFETIDELVFAEPSDMTLLGVRTLEGFSATVDTLGRKLVATPTIAA